MKSKEKTLKRPSLFRRTWKIWLYNLIWTAVFFGIFLGFYSLDVLCYELDWFLMFGFEGFRLSLFGVAISFWYFFRQIFKDCNLIKYTYLTAKHDEEILSFGYKRAYEGTEGTGKTLNTANDTLFVGCEKDYKMRLSYYKKYPFRDELVNDRDFRVLEDCYNYFQNHDMLPHVMTNFKFLYLGQKSYPFRMEYLDQKMRLAEGFSIGLTEVGNILPNAWSKIHADDKKDKHNVKVKTETLSLSRQWFDATMIVDEQRTGEMLLSLRSVISRNIVLIEKKKVLKPYFLMFIHKRLENIIMRKKIRTSRFLSELHTKLGLLIEDIGFYKFIYADKEAIKDVIKEKDLSFVISCDIPFEFDTRGERDKYALYSRSPE